MAFQEENEVSSATPSGRSKEVFVTTHTGKPVMREQ